MIKRSEERPVRATERNIKRRVLLVGAALALLLTNSFVTGTAMANPPRVTRGDAEAVLNAFTTGGRTIFLHRGIVEGGPADGFSASLAAIRPVPPFDGRHYCADDWHVILLALFDGGDSSFTYEDAVASLSPTSIDFRLDGSTLNSDRLSIRRFLYPEAFGLQEAYGYTQGTVLSPGDLSPGQHTLIARISDPSGFDLFTITFYVDPSGTGACVQ
jgi:hypothetical protein